MNDDLWVEASHDAEAETRALNLEAAKHVASPLWPFLAQASSPQEYADRSALAAENITTIAKAYDLPQEMLTSIFDQRFALLMEAGGNPFADDSQDDSGDDDKESQDDGGDDSDDSEDDNSNNGDDDDNGDGQDDNSDSDEDSDDTGDGDDEDNDSDGDGGSDNTPPWAARMSALHARINAGEDPLAWGGAAPFVDSPLRHHAADGATKQPKNEDESTDDPTDESDESTDPSVDPSSGDPHQPSGPQGPTGSPGPDGPAAPYGPQGAPGEQDDAPQQPAGPAGPLGSPGPDGPAGPTAPLPPGMEGGIAETTKPRQLPEGGDPGMGLTDEFDPALNGGDIEQGADSTPPGVDDTDDDTDKTAARKIAVIAYEVKLYNHSLTRDECYKIARRVYDTYLTKQAEDVNPLLYGDRGPVGDGPISGPLKHWSPKDMKPPKVPGMPSAPGGGTPPALPGTPTPPAGGGAAAEGAGAGELAEGAAGASRLLPLLAL